MEAHTFGTIVGSKECLYLLADILRERFPLSDLGNLLGKRFSGPYAECFSGKEFPITNIGKQTVVQPYAIFDNSFGCGTLQSIMVA